MNVAELIGELESAIDEAQRVGKRVQKAIVALRDIFGSVIPSSDLALVPSSDLAMKEPDMPRPAPEPTIPCPYCGKMFPEFKRHRGGRHYNRFFRMHMHVARKRIKWTDHGEKHSPIPPVDP